MRIFILYIIYGIVVISLQSTWFSDFPTSNYHFDFLIIAVAHLGFCQEWRRAIPILIIFGILYDVASAGPFGMAICSYLTIYGLIRLIVAKIAYQSVVSRFAWIAIASLLDRAICAFLVLIWGYPIDLAELMISQAPIQALINSCLGLAMIPFLDWYSGLMWSKMFRPKRIVVK